MDRIEALSLESEVRYALTSHKHKGAVDLAFAALKEQEQGEQGCEACRGITMMSGAFNGTGPGDENHLLGVDYDGDFDFCPVCGRKL